jgi:hypothetical protein
MPARGGPHSPELDAEFTGMPAKDEAAFRVSMIELVVLTLMIVALVASSLLMLRSRHPHAVATRA